MTMKQFTTQNLHLESESLPYPEGSDSTAIDLTKFLATANRFAYLELKIRIETKLIQESLNFETSVDLLFFADAQDCFMFKEPAIGEIVSNYQHHRLLDHLNL
jgi:hypothetical protein